MGRLAGFGRDSTQRRQNESDQNEDGDEALHEMLLYLIRCRPSSFMSRNTEGA